MRVPQMHHLLNNGAEVNQRDEKGFTPLHRAAYLAHYNGYLELYEYLLVRDCINIVVIGVNDCSEPVVQACYHCQKMPFRSCIECRAEAQTRQSRRRTTTRTSIRDQRRRWRCVLGMQGLCWLNLPVVLALLYVVGPFIR